MFIPEKTQNTFKEATDKTYEMDTIDIFSVADDTGIMDNKTELVVSQPCIIDDQIGVVDDQTGVCVQNGQRGAENRQTCKSSPPSQKINIEDPHVVYPLLPEVHVLNEQRHDIMFRKPSVNATVGGQTGVENGQTGVVNGQKSVLDGQRGTENRQTCKSRPPSQKINIEDIEVVDHLNDITFHQKPSGNVTVGGQTGVVIDQAGVVNSQKSVLDGQRDIMDDQTDVVDDQTVLVDDQTGVVIRKTGVVNDQTGVTISKAGVVHGQMSEVRVWQNHHNNRKAVNQTRGKYQRIFSSCNLSHEMGEIY